MDIINILNYFNAKHLNIIVKCAIINVYICTLEATYRKEKHKTM